MQRLPLCPSCKNTLVFSDGYAKCTKCGVGVNLEQHKGYVLESAPDPIYDSFKILKLMVESKYMFVFGNADLFSPGFKSDLCEFYASTKCIDTNTPPVLLSYMGIPAFLFKKMLFNFPVVGNRIVDTIRSMSAEEMLSAWLLVPDFMRQNMSYTDTRVLSMIVAPTWADCAEAYKGRVKSDVLAESESDLLYSLIACDKFSIIGDSDFMKSMEDLRNFMLTQSKFIHHRNDKLTMKIANKDLACSAYPEISINNQQSCEDFVGWFFATNEQYKEPTKECLTEFEASARGMEIMWKRYGKPHSVADCTVPKHFGSNLESYISYWEEMRQILQKGNSQLVTYV